MCQSKRKINELRKKKTLTKGDILTLAESQADDYMTHTKEHSLMIKRIENIETNIDSIKSDVNSIKGQLSVIMEYIKSPADSERFKGHALDFLATVWKKPIFWIAVVIVALAGDKLVTIITNLFPHLIGG